MICLGGDGLCTFSDARILSRSPAVLVSRASTNTRCLPNRIGISWAAPLSLHGDVVPDVCVDRAGAIGVDSMSVQSLLVADTTSRNNVLSYCMLEQHKVQTLSGFKGHMFGGDGL